MDTFCDEETRKKDRYVSQDVGEPAGYMLVMMVESGEDADDPARRRRFLTDEPHLASTLSSADSIYPLVPRLIVRDYDSEVSCYHSQALKFFSRSLTFFLNSNDVCAKADGLYALMPLARQTPANSHGHWHGQHALSSTSTSSSSSFHHLFIHETCMNVRDGLNIIAQAADIASSGRVHVLQWSRWLS